MKSRKNIKSLFFVLLVLVLVSLACLSSENNAINEVSNSGPTTADLDATTVALQKTQTAIESAEDEIIVPENDSDVTENVYYTEFEDLIDWEFFLKSADDYNNSEYIIQYFDPGLDLYVPYADDWLSLYYDLWVTNVRLEVDFEFIGGAEESSIDVYCRSNESGEYAFSIYGDGFWEIGYYDYAGDNGFTSFVSGQTTLNDGTNFMVGYCDGDELTLFINEEFEGETLISTIDAGALGLGLLTFDSGAGEWFINYFAAEIFD